MKTAVSITNAQKMCWAYKLIAFSLVALLASTAAAYLPGDAIPVAPQPPINTRVTTTQKRDDVWTLEPGKPIERELAGNESHSYQVALASGQYVHLVVAQPSIDVVVTAFGPDGQEIISVNVNYIGYAEEVSLAAETSGHYRLEVRPAEKKTPRGRYEVKIEELRVATGQDKSRVAAGKAFAAGAELYRQGTAESRRRAIEKYQESAALSRAAKDSAGEATALYMICASYGFLGEKQKALDFCDQALPLARAAGDRRAEAYTLDTMGDVHNNFGDKRKALELFNQALPLRQASGDRVGEAHTLNNMAIASFGLGERQKALDFFNRGLLILRDLGDRRKEATTLGNICVTYRGLGNAQKAFDFCSQALRTYRDLANRQDEAIALNNLGTVYSDLGEYQQALDSYTQAYTIHKDFGDRRGEAVTLNNLGWVYGALGEYRKAVDYYNQALEPFRAMGDRYAEATTLSNIGVNHAQLKEYREALEFHQQSLSMRRSVGDAEGEAISLNNIAGSYSELGDKQKALDYYQQALSRHRAVGNRVYLAGVLHNIGSYYRKLGEHQKASDHFNEALQLRQSIRDRSGEAATLSEIALLERDRGNLPDARNHIEAALAAVESLRTGIKSQQLRASYFASVRKYHELNIDLLMRLHKQRPSEGFDARALAAGEKARARSLLELLAEARAEIRQGVDPALIERERSLQQSISDRAERQTRLLGGKHSAEQAEAAAKEIDTLTTEYEQLQARIRQTSPRYAALTQPVPLSLKEIQTEVLDDETLLLEYALGEEKSFLWAVTPASIHSFELPGRAEIEAAARRVYELITARNLLIPKETPEQRRLRLGSADAEYPRAAAVLSRMLLGPAAPHLGARRLLIVSEGMLQYVPFAALPKPGTRGGGGKETRGQKNFPLSPPPLVPLSPPLIVHHEIVSLPSASVLAALRRETTGRGVAAKTVAVLADPVFDNNDPRIGALGKGRATGIEESALPTLLDVKRSAADSGLAGFVRLRFSRQEAEQIVRLAPEGKTLKTLDFAASRAAATSADLGQFRIVHFATHGLINSRHPELSGIVLSLVDEEGRPQNGFLRLYEIYNLRLGADLVVLSACQTALGKEVKGEGLVGLTRGFMYAGAPRVAASLWRIDDRATAELMKRFYQRMLGEGMSPASALRAAQVSMLREKRWEAPHYWAGFTLQGEWK